MFLGYLNILLDVGNLLNYYWLSIIKDFLNYYWVDSKMFNKKRQNISILFVLFHFYNCFFLIISHKVFLLFILVHVHSYFLQPKSTHSFDMAFSLNSIAWNIEMQKWGEQRDVCMIQFAFVFSALFICDDEIDIWRVLHNFYFTLILCRFWKFCVLIRKSLLDNFLV